MPTVETTLTVPRPPSEVFAYFARPAHWVTLSRPKILLQLVSGPELLYQGAEVSWKAQRLGVTQHVLQEVAEFENERRIVLRQKKGPFKVWLQALHFGAAGEGTLFHEAIEFTPPGGMLGLLVTEEKIVGSLRKEFAHRAEKLRELFQP